MVQLLFDNGARTVYARRVFDPATAKPATFTLADETGAQLLTLRARTPGAWGNRLQVKVEPAEPADARQPVRNELVSRSNGTILLSAARVVAPAGDAESNVVGRVVVRESGLTTRYQLRVGAASGTAVQVDPGTRRLTFLDPPAPEAEIRADYLVPMENLRRVTFRSGTAQEVFVVPSAAYLAQQLADGSVGSNLVEVVQAHGAGLPRATTGFEAFTGGDNGAVSADDLRTRYEAALEALVDQPVQVVVVGAGFSTVKAPLLGHVERTENLGRERIAVVGADSSTVEKILENSNDVADKRIVLVAPGIRQVDGRTGRVDELPPLYAAAAVAGKLASLAVHVSLTNKPLAGVEGPAVEYNYGQLASLVQNRVLVLERKRGVRVVKGISTDDGAFSQISVRRIVDYGKEGTRRGANQYIGRLNNRRVRENLRTTLDSFLADSQSREYLTGYTLKVSATRQQEIRGEVLVEMDLMPTFSIDVIRVVMTLV
jgi:hypothetical protein